MNESNATFLIIFNQQQEKAFKNPQKHVERGDRARHGHWQDMATTQPTILKIDHPEKEKSNLIKN